MNAQSVVMIGATGAVGGVVVKTLAAMPQLQRLTLLGRRPVEGISGAAITQQLVDVFDPTSYAKHLPGHATAICTLGVGQRAGMSRQEFVRIDKTAVLENGTLAGSILTMDAAFRMLVTRIGLSLIDAARMCATTPAESIKAADLGAIAAGKWADLTVLDRDLHVMDTYIGGEAAGN